VAAAGAAQEDRRLVLDAIGITSTHHSPDPSGAWTVEKWHSLAYCRKEYYLGGWLRKSAALSLPRCPCSPILSRKSLESLCWNSTCSLTIGDCSGSELEPQQPEGFVGLPPPERVCRVGSGPLAPVICLKAASARESKWTHDFLNLDLGRIAIVSCQGASSRPSF
jgi:hypothetical protein